MDSILEESDNSVVLPPKKGGDSGIPLPFASKALTTALASSKDRKLSSNATLEKMTVNKLRFSEVKLVGRDKEISLLKERLAHLTTTTAQQYPPAKELVLIRGVSGTGKSSLAYTLRDELRKKQKKTGGGSVFVSGKFDLNQKRHEPYYTIVESFKELCGVILELATTNHQDTAVAVARPNFQDIRGALVEELVGIELFLLTNALPILRQIIEYNNNGDDEDEIMGGDGHSISSVTPFACNNKQMLQNKELLESAFRKFIRIASLHFGTLVIFLDDLQWTDVGTLELLKSSVTDQQANAGCLMVIGCYRSNEVDATHIVSQTIRDLKQQQRSGNLCITEIEVGNLGIHESNQILMALLSMDNPSETQPLAEICQRRTLGNVFFLLLFVDMLHKDGHLQFHLGTFRWSWDIHVIEEKTAATENVVNLMKGKMSRSTPEVVGMLKLACCLGNCFQKSILRLVWDHCASFVSSSKEDNNNNDNDNDNDDDEDPREHFFSQLLDGAVEENFLERSPGGGYRWVHDKVQEAAMSLDSEEELYMKRQQQVGNILRFHLAEEDLEENLFVIVYLLNNGLSQKSIELAELNLKAAIKSKSFSDFESQAIYAEKGLSNLLSSSSLEDGDDDGCWTSHRELSLELYSILAEAYGCLGKIDEMNHYCKIVIDQDNCSILEKVRCYDALINGLGRTGRTTEAMDVGLDVLGKLGCKISRTSLPQSVGAVAALFRLQGDIKKKFPTTQKLSEMPLMTDPIQIEVMKLLSRVSVYAYQSKHPMVWTLLVLRLCYLTLEYGLSEESPVGFSSLAIVVMHVLHDWDMGANVATLSIQMCEYLENRIKEPFAINVSHFFVYAWVQPIQGQLRWFMESYKLSLQSGNVELAFQNVYFYVIGCTISGTSLQSIDEDCRIYLPQFETLKANAEFNAWIRVIWQAVLNLKGTDGGDDDNNNNNNNTTLLTGSVMDETEYLKTWDGNSIILLLTMKSQLCVFFGDHEMGAKIALEKGDQFLKEMIGGTLGILDTFHRGVSLYAIARKTKKMKYKNHANKVRRTIRGWVKKGNPNVLHYLNLLDAEHAALSRKTDVAKQMYREAVKTAVRGGFVQDAALASERHAEYLLERKETEDAVYELLHSIQYYKDWGATRKVERLRHKYSDLFSD